MDSNAGTGRTNGLRTAIRGLGGLEEQDVDCGQQCGG